MERMAERLIDDPPPHLQLGEASNDREAVRKMSVSRMLKNGVRNLRGVICSNMGGISSKVTLGILSELADGESQGIHSIVVTGDLSEMEEEALARLN